MVNDFEFEIIFEKCPTLSLILAITMSIFSASYKCEQISRKKNFIVLEARIAYTQQNSVNALIVATAKLCFDLEENVYENKYRCSE